MFKIKSISFHKKSLLPFISSLLFLTGCSSVDIQKPEEEKEPVSMFTGKAGGTKFSDIFKKEQSNDGVPVNALLWRAALDIASFVPLDDVDTFGGSIVTEWHQAQTNLNERFKLAIFVLGRELRSDAIKVRTYVQKRQDGGWFDSGRDEVLSRKIENLILSRARELRSAATAETLD